MPDGQRQFEWAADTLKAACARCGLAGIETKLFLCAAAERDPRLGGEETGMLGRPAVMEGESVWRIDGSIRGVAERLGASEKGLRLALGRLEAKGLATSGRDRAGSSIVLCVGRLFADSGGVSDEPEMERPLKLPPPGGADRVRTGCGPGAESVRSGVRSFSESEKGMNIPSENLSLRTESETLRDSAPNSAPNSARVRTAWQDVDDATLESLDRRWLRALFRCARSYRWDGLPVPVHNQAWRLERIEEQEIVLRLQVGPGQSWRLGVVAEAVHLTRMRQLASGEAEAGTAWLMRRRRKPRPGETQVRRSWFLRISGLFPRPTSVRGRTHQERTLRLGHDQESLWFGSIDGDPEAVFEYTGFALRKAIVGHDRMDRRRQVDDSLRRGLWSRRKQRRWTQDRSAACARARAKIDAELHLAVTALVRWCRSHRVTAIDYETDDRGFLPHFPYARLAEFLRTACENEGLALHLLTAEEVQA